MFSYEKLEIWRMSINFAKEIYGISSKFPKFELYGLVNQLQRAAVSMSANIAEGSGSSTVKDQCNYLDTAIKSALEVTSEIQIAFELDYIDQVTRDQLYNQAEIIIKKIRAFKNFLKNHKLSTIHHKQL